MQPRTRPKQALCRFGLMVAGVALVMSACSSDSKTSSSSGGSGSSSTSNAAAVLGTKKPATGTPLTIGYIDDGTSDAVDRSAEFTAAQASIKYVNDYLGGIGGHPVTLQECSTGSTPAGAADCVTKMVTAKVPVVLNGVTSLPADVYPPLSDAGIPVFSTGALDQKSLSAPGVYLMGNPILTVLAGPAQVAANAGIKQAAIVVVDNPAASGQVSAAAPLFYGNVGVGVDVVTIPIDQADVAPQITAEMAKNPGMFQVIGDAPFCGKVMRALDSVGFTGQINIIPQCIDGGANLDLPNLAGSIVLGTTSTDPNDKEVQLYNAVMETYGDSSLEGNATANNGYQAVVGFARAVAALTGDVTPASVKAAVEAAPPTPYPLAGGLTYQCNHTAVSIAPNICSNSALQTSLDAQGKGTTYTVLDGTKVLTISN
jgi:branched-chain amino acid transport system substrate-binding protein